MEYHQDSLAVARYIRHTSACYHLSYRMNMTSGIAKTNGIHPEIADYLNTLVAMEQIPGWQLMIAQAGKVIYHNLGGWLDVMNQQPVEKNTWWRWYSMTKPITSIAALQLVERGLLQLDDSIATWLPAFAEPQVYISGNEPTMNTRAATGPIRVRHLLTHTAGFTYGQANWHPVDALYREHGCAVNTPATLDLAGLTELYASFPLLFDPGTAWNYSCATDILGRLIEVVSGQNLANYCAANIFTPLGMTQTKFGVPETALKQLPTFYRPAPNDSGLAIDAEYGVFGICPPALLGGAGLIGTMSDYLRFASCLAHGGELDGARIIEAEALAQAVTNQLPGKVRIGDYLVPGGTVENADHGFGYGFSVADGATATSGHRGEYGWGGYAGTRYWTDPATDLTVIFGTSVADGPDIATPLHSLVAAAFLPA